MAGRRVSQVAAGTAMADTVPAKTERISVGAESFMLFYIRSWRDFTIVKEPPMGFQHLVPDVVQLEEATVRSYAPDAHVCE